MKLFRPLIPALLLFLASCATPSSSSAPAPEPSSSEPSSSSVEPSSSSTTPSSSTEPSSSSSVEPSSSSSVEPSSSSSSSSSTIPEPTPKYAPINTKSMTDVPEGFIYGMDASAVPSLENAGVVYRDNYGNVKDVFEILAEHGVTHVRVRVWNDPKDANGNYYGGGNCDVANAIAIGKRVTAAGMKLHVDFHYSDFWADPAKQKAPKAWATYDLAQKKAALYEFTATSLQAMKDEGIDVGMVQVGNETNQGKLAGESGWDNFCGLVAEGSKAVREKYPDALVAVHFTNPEKKSGGTSYPVYFASQLNQRGLDYDVFGTSYYPYWHGTLDNLSTVLSDVATRYHKKVMVMETSYAYTNTDTDYHGNTSPQGSDVKPHDISIQGQYDQIYDVIDTIAHNTTSGIGVCYWEGTWISVNKGSYNANKEAWEKYGCGWAASYAGEYDPDDAGKWYGGCAVDNQAFFDQEGYVLPSLEVFNNQAEDTPIDPEDPTEVPEFFVSGSFNGWAEKNAGYKMTYDADNGIYVYEGLNAKANATFKVMGDEGWFPDADQTIPSTGQYKVTFNATTHAVSYERTGEYEGETSDVTYYLSGSFNGWGQKDTNYVLSRYEEDIEGKAQYHIRLDLPVCTFQVMDSDGVWYPGGSTNNYAITTAGTYDVYFCPQGVSNSSWHHGFIYAAAA